jgi:hypothetical protein
MAITLQASGNTASDKDAWEYVDSAIWDGPLVSEIIFNLDKTKYTQWVLTHFIDPYPTWSGVALKFMYDGQNEVSSVNPEPYPSGSGTNGLQNSWDSATLYMGADFTSPTYSNEYGNAGTTYLWCQGNGPGAWSCYGQMLISVPDTDVNYASVRNWGGLAAISAYNAGSITYMEETTGTLKSKYSRQITAVKLTGEALAGSAGITTSRKGYVILQGVRR